METALIPFDPGVVAINDLRRAEAYARNSRAENTRRGYSSDWRQFEAWCRSAGACSMPAAPETVALYAAHLAEHHKPATVARHLAAIASGHKERGHDSPASMRHGAVSAVWHGIRRTHGTAPAQKTPVTTAEIRAIVESLPETLIGMRDRALLLVGFAGAFRRSELVALSREDVDFSAAGVVVLLRRSKTDQEGAGRKVGIPYGSNPDTCPVRCLQAWIEAAGITSGPLFRPVTCRGRIQAARLAGAAVAKIIKRRAAAIGLDAKKYSGHSLRSGLATAAAIAGASERSIMNQTGHHSSAMVRRYIRDSSLFRDNAAAKVGL